MKNRKSSRISDDRPEDIQGADPVPDAPFDILIVDDSFFARERLRNGLAALGRKVDAVGNGSDATTLLSSHVYSIVVTDLSHPGVAGLAMIREIRNRGLATVIVVSTADRSLKTVYEALEAGADDYVLKPYGIQQLKQVIRRALDAKEQSSALSQDGPLPEEQSHTRQASARNTAVAAFLAAFEATEPSERQKALADLVTMERDGRILFEAYQNTENPGRSKIAAVLRMLSDKRVDIRIPDYTMASRFANDLLRLNPVNEGPSKPSPSDVLVTYRKLAASSAERSHLVRQEIAKDLEPALNAVVQGMNQGTLEEKKAICEFVNGELEPLGLAVKCPNTGLPGKLKATSGNWPEIGRFHFEVYIDGERKKSAFSDNLPSLNLIDAHIESHFRNMVGPKSSRKGRNLP